MNDWTPLTSCVACGSVHLQNYFDAGEQPLANSFHQPDDVLPTFPLGLNLCLDCGHSQNLGAVKPELMFQNYPYVSGTTLTLRNYFAAFAEDISRASPKAHVLEIGCNDGSLLREFQKRGHECLGIDPAENIVSDDVKRLVSYWNESTAADIGKFDIIIAMNVMGHVADPLAFLTLCKNCLSDTGTILIQTSQSDMVATAEFDTVYHEHISFFDRPSFVALANRCGLSMPKLIVTNIHGGSWLAEFRKGPTEEREFFDIPTDLYLSFERHAQQRVTDVVNILDKYHSEGFAIVGFGAAAKANTFLNYGKINLDYMVDENSLKQGTMTPGMNILVHPVSVISSDPRPILFVLTAWNFKNEIIQKIKNLRSHRLDIVMTYFPTIEIDHIVDEAA